MIERPHIVGAILAGGLSRRMAMREKSLIELAGVPLLAHARDRLAPQVARLVISANGDPARFARFCLPVQLDILPDHAGPLAGLLSAMQWAQVNLPTASHVLSVSVDAPFFPLDLCEHLAVNLTGKATIALAASGGRTHQIFGLWPIASAPDLHDFLVNQGGRKVMDFVECHPCALANFEFLQTAKGLIDPFFNINSPGDMLHAREVCAEIR